MNYKKYIAELIGTAFLVFAGSAVAVSVNTMLAAMGIQLPIAVSMFTVAITFGLSYMAMYYSLAKTSGAHLNPAVSFGMLISGYLSIKDAVIYMISQFVGGLVGAALCGMAINYRDTLFSSGYEGMSIFGTSLKTAIIIDIIMSFFFVYLFISVTANEKLKNLGGIIIGLGFTLVYVVEIPFTNGSSNPARSLGTALLQTQGNALSQVWIFIAAPLLGAALAGLFYIFLNPSKYDEVEVAEVDDIELCPSEETADDEETVLEVAVEEDSVEAEEQVDSEDVKDEDVKAEDESIDTEQTHEDKEQQ